ncbi:hypothetical protein GCM10027074_33940 [Streptomyces deserti]
MSERNGRFRNAQRGPPQARTPLVRRRFPRAEAAAGCQLPPPPHPPPPPPQDDPPPQDEPPPECPPPSPEDDPTKPPPAHQLLSPLSRRLEATEVRPRAGRVRPPPLRASDTNAATNSTPITARMMPKTMASPSFRSPEAAPRRASLVV